MFTLKQHCATRSLALALTVVSTVVLVSACQSVGGGSGSSQQDVKTGDATAGRLVYENSCAGCHGAPGRNDGEAPDLSEMGAAGIEAVLNGGEHPGGLPGDLSGADFDHLAAYLGQTAVDDPDTPRIPDEPGTPETSGFPEIPAFPDRPELPRPPAEPERPDVPGGPTVPAPTGGSCDACLTPEDIEAIIPFLEGLRADGWTQAEAVEVLKTAMADDGVDPNTCPGCAEDLVAEVYGSAEPGLDIPTDPATPRDPCEACLIPEETDVAIEYAAELRAAGWSQAEVVSELANAMATAGVDLATCPNCAENLVAAVYAGAGPGPGPETPGPGATDPFLVGTWWYEDSFWNDLSGFSSTTIVTVQYLADGTYHETNQTCAYGDATACSDVIEHTGRWTASDGWLSVTYEDGSSAGATYYIEDQPDGRVMMTQAGGTGERRLWTYRG